MSRPLSKQSQVKFIFKSGPNDGLSNESDKLFQQAKGLLNQGEIERARDVFEKIIKINNKHFDALHLLGIIAAQLKEFEKADRLFGEAIKINPRDAVVYCNRGNVAKETHNLEIAISYYDKAIYLKPDYALAQLNRSIILFELKKYEVALLGCKKALLIKPYYAEAFYNQGNILDKIKQYDEALKSYDKVIEYNQLYTESVSNRGVLLNELKRYEEAIESFDKAIELKPDEASNYYNKSLLLLSLKDFINGWELYDWRWKDHSLGFIQIVSNKPKLNNINSIQNKKILIWSEQGVGDQILYASMFKQLFELAPQSLVALDKRLLPVMKRSFPDGNFLANDIDFNTIEYDEHCPIADLGKYFRTKLEDFETSNNKYLKVDSQTSIKIRTKLIGKNKLLCGVKRSSKTNKVGIEKSIQLEDKPHLFHISNIAFVNLQYGDVQDNLIQLEEEHNIDIQECSSVDNFNDLDGHATLIAACDLIVSISNTSSHIAGAIGKETYLMCPTGKGFLWYRANQVNGNSLWHPSIQIFEQKIAGQWSDIAQSIRKLIEDKVNVTE